jgi:hypothetical protein
MKIMAHNQVSLQKLTRFWLPFLGVSAGYFILIAFTVSYLGIGWDEEVDLRIAQAYLTPRGFFFGLPLDLTQTRLPMFAVAIIYKLLGVSDLLTARWISVGAGWLTLLAVYIYGKDRFNQHVGLLASGLLAISPFFLSFARLAFTESDIFVACTMTWLLVAVYRLQENFTVGRAAVAGVLLGLSLSSKATVVVIIPAIWIALYGSRGMAKNRDGAGLAPANLLVKNSTVLFWSAWAILILAAGVYVGIRFNLDNYSLTIRLIHYGWVWLGWAVLFIWILRCRNHTAGLAPLAFLFTAVGLLTFLLFPPDHLTNSDILKSLFQRAEDEMSFSAQYMIELAALHLLAILFKSTLLLGAGLLISIIVSMLRWREVGLLPLLVLASYFSGLLLLPLGQTFYTVPLLPILSLLAANAFMRLWGERRKIAYVGAFLSIGWWGFEVAQSYPDYHLNGYQWLGPRVLFGRSSISYGSVVYTPADGVQQAIEWLNSHAEPDQNVQLYLGPWHIVRHVAPDPSYRLSNGFEETLEAEPDYVVVHINETIWSGNDRDTPVEDVIRYPFDLELLMQEYEKVFSVERSFELEMISIWRRK